MSISDYVANNVAHMGNDYSRGHTCGTTERQRSRVALVALSVIMLLCAFVCLPSRAYAVQASGGVIWGPDYLPGGNGQRAAVVNANNKYVAAALALGYSVADISGWSDDVLAKLSNASTGGSFYQYAQTFSQFSYDGGGPVGAILEALGNAFFAVAESLYGNAIWISVYDENLGLNAALDLKAIVEGGNAGGGGSDSGTTEFPHTLVLTNYVGEVSKITLNFSDSFVNSANNMLANYPYYQVAVTSRYANRYWISFIFADKPFNTTSVLAGKEGKKDLYSIHANYVEVTNIRRFAYRNDVVVAGTEWTLNVSYFPASYSSETKQSGEYSDNTGEAPVNGGYINSSANPPSPPVPPTNWPDEPSAPSPPELPEPGTDVPVDPTPWSPFISLPDFDFDINVTTEPTTNDLIDWVKKIYFELKAFHEDAHSWFVDISLGFDGVIQAVNHTCSQLYSQLLVVDNTLRDEGLKLRNYLYQMFHWLAGQFNFQNDPFNDSNIVYWLRRIWSKLGNGDINLRPTDPTNDPDNWWDWLIRAIQNFLIGLAAGTNDLISDIADLVSQVMHQFPFSIPWDIAAILAALTTAPITPEFTITIPAVQYWWSSFDIVIDLEPFDTAAETIRLMEKLLFTGFLIWKSKDLLDFMDVTRWFEG